MSAARRSEYDLADDGTPEDISEIFASGWAWASGGHHLDAGGPEPLHPGLCRRQAVRPEGAGAAAPLGAWGRIGADRTGTNSAGLALFRYQTRCGTVLGHTGNTFGFTQFAAATPDGTRSTTVSISLQRTRTSQGWPLAVFQALRAAEEQAVCAALAERK